MSNNPSYLAEEARNESFKSILEGLQGRRKAVFECILTNYPISNEEIAEKLHIKVQSVTGRVHELRGNLYDYDLKRSVLQPDKIFIEFDSYVLYADKEKKKPIKKSGIRWKPTEAAKKLYLEMSLFDD